jgi:hypothetical protein
MRARTRAAQKAERGGVVAFSPFVHGIARSTSSLTVLSLIPPTRAPAFGTVFDGQNFGWHLRRVVTRLLRRDRAICRILKSRFVPVLQTTPWISGLCRQKSSTAAAVSHFGISPSSN